MCLYNVSYTRIVRNLKSSIFLTETGTSGQIVQTFLNGTKSVSQVLHGEWKRRRNSPQCRKYSVYSYIFNFADAYIFHTCLLRQSFQYF